MLGSRLKRLTDFQVQEINKRDSARFDSHMKILEETYAPLNFFRPSVVSKEDTTCFGSWHEGNLEEIFSLNPIRSDGGEVFRALIDEVRTLSGAHRHAWNSETANNFALFNLGLHAGHHVKPGKRLYTLTSDRTTLKLPSGYFTMALLALFPPVWTRLMDSRIQLARKHYPHE